MDGRQAVAMEGGRAQSVARRSPDGSRSGVRSTGATRQAPSVSPEELQKAPWRQASAAPAGSSAVRSPGPRAPAVSPAEPWRPRWQDRRAPAVSPAVHVSAGSSAPPAPAVSPAERKKKKKRGTKEKKKRGGRKPITRKFRQLKGVLKRRKVHVGELVQKAAQSTSQDRLEARAGKGSLQRPS